MKKYVSLGAALMLGTVLARGRKDKDHSIAKDKHHKKEKAELIPQNNSD